MTDGPGVVVHDAVAEAATTPGCGVGEPAVAWDPTNRRGLDEVASRVRAAEQMRDSYRAIFGASPQPMCVVDPAALQLVEVNEAAARAYGYAREELLTMRSPDLWPAEDREKNLAIVARPLPIENVLMRHRRKDGSLWWVEVQVKPVVFDGRQRRLVLINDVTRRIVAEEAQKAAETRFARLAGSGIIGILVSNLDGRVLEVNAALADLLGHSREELLSGDVRWPDLTPGEWRDIDQRAVEQLNRTGVASLREKEYRRKDGTRVPVLVGSAMLEGTGNDCISFVLDLRGSLEAAAAVEQLREARASEATFRGLVEAAPDAVVIITRDGTIDRVNSQAEKLYGYSREELVGRPAEMLVVERFRDTFPARLERYFTEARAQRRGAGLEAHGCRKDGSEFPIEFTIGLVETAHGPLVCASIRDTTERRKAEEARLRLAAMVDSSDDAIIGKTFEGIVTSWNGGARRLFGYSAEEMIGRPLAVLIPPDRMDEEAEILRHLAAGEVERFDTVRLHKNGREIDVSVTSSPVRGSRSSSPSSPKPPRRWGCSGFSSTSHRRFPGAPLDEHPAGAPRRGLRDRREAGRRGAAADLEPRRLRARPGRGADARRARAKAVGRRHLGLVDATVLRARRPRRPPRDGARSPVHHRVGDDRRGRGGRGHARRGTRLRAQGQARTAARRHRARASRVPGARRPS
jgi:PAS domain S-box-containing protein